MSDECPTCLDANTCGAILRDGEDHCLSCGALWPAPPTVGTLDGLLDEDGARRVLRNELEAALSRLSRPTARDLETAAWRAVAPWLARARGGPTTEDRAINALAAWLNGGDHEVAPHHFIAARLVLDRLDRDALLRDAIELEG